MIDIRNFSKYYDGRKILDSVTLSAEEGETLVIIGKSGCGKSTLLRHIGGLENEETGKIEGEIVIGKDIPITKLKEKEILARNIRGMFVGMLFQNSALFDFLTVEGNLLWPMEENLDISEEEMRNRMIEALGMVDISPDFLERDVNTLSGGEKKRVALARALVLEPKIILYDEPTTGLDPPTAFEINKLINRLKKKKKITSVVTTHDMWSAEKVADKIAMIADGKIVFIGTYEEAMENRQVRTFMEGGEKSE
ncbi:MAG: ATP-binding cassette domain-containing protein [Planctomycetota bacterium]|nr:MAG: ATP-binding cassette domain-containing protein [Planctomycetota bacterium]